MKNQYLIFIYLIVSATTILGQTFDINAVIPNSPTTEKFTEIMSPQISEFTGQSNTTIPIFKINVDGFTLPIYLQYNSKGVKVAEESTWVGQSWSLIAGGMISRNQIGLPDDIKNDVTFIETLVPVQNPINGQWSTYLCHSPEVVDNSGWLYSNDLIQTVTNYFDQHGTVPVNSPVPYRLSRGGLDAAPDLFTISLSGLNHSSFFFSDETKVNFFENSNTKVIYTIEDESKGITKFKVYDEKGNIFFFEDVEYLRYQRDYINGNSISTGSNPRQSPVYSPIFHSGIFSNFWGAYGSYVCNAATYNEAIVSEYTNRLWPKAWHITKIITTKGKSINFEYEQEDAYTLSNTRISNNPYFHNGQIAFKYSNDLQKMKYPRLTKIVWDEGEVNFVAPSIREDVYNNPTENIVSSSKKLGAIVIKNKFNKKIKEFIFNQSYKLAQGYTNSLQEQKKTMHKRLWLNSIDILGRDNNSLGSYNFTYDDTVMPNKFSYEQDYWGYYNNNNSNNFIPNLWYYPNENRDYTDKGKFSIYPREGYTGTVFRSSDFLLSQGVADRRPNPTFSKTGILTSITYPLGGEIAFEYEPNTFLYRGTSVIGPGLRVSRTVLNENQISPPIITDYIYEENGDTSGRIASLPLFTGLARYPSASSLDAPIYYFSSHPFNSLDLSINNNFGYTRVEKIYSQGDLGKEVLKFSFPVDLGTSSYTSNNGDVLYSSILPQINSRATYVTSISPNPGETDNLHDYFPYAYETNFSLATGKLISRETFDADLNILKQQENNFDFSTNYTITNGFFQGPEGQANVRYLSANYHLLESLEQDHLEGAILEKSSVFEYDSNYQLSKTTITDSKGDIITKSYKYPYHFETDFNGSPNTYSSMIENNMYAYTIESTTKRNNVITSAMIHEFKSVNSNYVLEKTFSLETDQVNYNYTSAQVNTAQNSIDKDLKMIEKSAILRHDDKGNVEEFQLTNDIPSVILWGYHKTKPIAIIRGASYNTLNTWFSNDFSQSLSHIQNVSDISSEDTFRIWLRRLRESISNHDQSNSVQLKTYTYEILVGVTSITDEKGYTMFYQYDEFNRLKYIKDHSGNILNKSEYHLKN